MVEREVVLAKVATIDRCLRRIEQTREPGRDLATQDAQDIVELNLLRAVQAGLDLVAHVAATEGLGLPGTLAESFTLLERAGMLSTELAERLRRMAGFRNIAVHEYTAIDPLIVDSIVEHHLDDLRALCRRVLTHFALE